MSVRRKKRRQDSELKLQVGVFGYRRGVCLDLLHQSHTTQPTDRLCEKLASRTNLAGAQFTEILTNSKTPSELTLASNAPNVSRQIRFTCKCFHWPSVSGGNLPGVEPARRLQ